MDKCKKSDKNVIKKKKGIFRKKKKPVLIWNSVFRGACIIWLLEICVLKEFKNLKTMEVFPN